MSIARVCIDSGGHRTPEVYKYCKPRETKGVYAIKGKGGTGMNIVHSYSKTKKVKNILFIIAVDTAKALLLTRLSNKKEDGDESYPAVYCHFPSDESRGYDEKYFNGLTSEIMVTRMVKGRPKTEWVLKSGMRNEPLDCRVYNISAIEILNPNFEELKRRKSQPVHRRRRIGSRGVDLE